MAIKKSSSASASKPGTRSKIAAPDFITSDLVEVRNSKIHGRGVYAVKPIARGQRIMEYVGERISHAESNRRFWDKDADDGHTFFFVVNNKVVIDGTHNGNDARFINHRCEPNCETVTDDNRIFIEAIRNIEPGEELGYDYQLTWESDDDPEELALYACRCGAPNCRGTMLDPIAIDEQRRLAREKKKRAEARATRNAALKKAAGKTDTAAKKKSAAPKTKAKAKSKSKPKSKSGVKGKR